MLTMFTPNLPAFVSTQRAFLGPHWQLQSYVAVEKQPPYS